MSREQMVEVDRVMRENAGRCLARLGIDVDVAALFAESEILRVK